MADPSQDMISAPASRAQSPVPSTHSEAHLVPSSSQQQPVSGPALPRGERQDDGSQEGGLNGLQIDGEDALPILLPPAAVMPCQTREVPMTDERAADTTFHQFQELHAENWKEWRSWKCRPVWLSCYLSLTLGLVTTILVLLSISKRDSGFVRLGAAPGFLAENPDLLKAVWSQGLHYTAVPTSLMTIYRTMWDGIVAAITERQPFVELRKKHGGPPEKTILLDYRAEGILMAPWRALRNGHIFLAACMITSVLLSIASVPATAFLFTPRSSSFEFPVSAAFTSEFNASASFAYFPGVPNVRLAVEVAAANLVLNAPLLPWTDTTSAYPAFSLTEDLPRTADDPSSVSVKVNTTAYLAKADCVVLREGDGFDYALVEPIPGMNIVPVHVAGRDRGCTFEGSLVFNLRREVGGEFRALSITTFPSVKCGKDAGWSRIGLIAARYTGNGDDVHSVSNITMVSCRPSYWYLPGVLNATLETSSTSVGGFEGDWSRAMEDHTTIQRMFIENSILEIVSYDSAKEIQYTNDFARHIFDITSSKSPDHLLRAEALKSSMSDLFEGTYAALAATTMFQTLTNPRNLTAIATVSDTRLIVVEPVAYFIVAWLLVVALLTVGVFFSARQPSSLFEEPMGLLSYAGIAQQSGDLAGEITMLMKERGFVGKFRERAVSDDTFMDAMWKFDQLRGTVKSSRRI